MTLCEVDVMVLLDLDFSTGVVDVHNTCVCSWI